MPFFSEEHKRQFTWKFGVIIAIAFVMQMVLPMAAMPLFMFSGTGGMETEGFDRAVSFKNRVYVLTRKVKFGFKNKGPQNTLALEEWADKKLATVPGLEIKENLETLIADERGIWMIYPDHYELFDGVKKIVDQKFKPPSPGQNPAVASDNDKLYIIYAFKEKPWLTWIKDKEQGAPVKLPAPPGSHDYCACGDQLMFWRGKLYHFSRYKKDIHLQAIDGKKVSDWVKLGEFPISDFKAGYDDKGLFLAGVYRGNTVGPAQMFKTTIKFARVENGKLSEPQEFKANNSLFDFSVINSTTGPAKIVGQSIGFGWMGITSMELSGKGAVKSTALKKNMGLFRSFWIMPLFYCIPILIIFILSVIATLMMPKYRTLEITLQDGVKYEFASVISRALSQAVDGLILAVPLIPVGFYVKYLLENPDNVVSKLIEPAAQGPAAFLAMMGLVMIGGFCYLALCILYFSILEGGYGWTIGKLVFKIRVLGEEGTPPGFMRALLRNFLRIVDGFFNFIVGIALIAFTDNWQRVGDLAARTVVVRKK